MAVSLSGISSIGSDLNTAAPTPRPTARPTEEEQVHQLLISGLSSQQIAAAIPLPLSEVDLTLGDTSTASTENTESALSERLSVSV